jgi:ssDNA-binding Zn-finger/Zn-ribbon topoisomerase 1
MNKNDFVIVACPPLSDFPESPKDQSESTLVDCPKCNSKMWISQKKKGVLMFSSCLNRDILFACYHCVKNYALKNPEIFSKSEMMNI